MKTTKVSLLGMLFLFFAGSTFAQFQIGVKAGMGGSTRSELGNICDNSNIRFAYNAGLTLRESLNDWFAMKGELQYAQRGSSFDFTKNGIKTEQTDKLDYLTIPVKAEFSTPVQNSKIFFATGPYVGFLLNAEQEVNGRSTDLKENTRDADFGMAMELGLIRPLGKTDMVFSVNYDMGFTQTSKVTDELQNKALTFNAAILF